MSGISNMEQIKSSVRPFSFDQQHRESLSKTPMYYRVTLFSMHRSEGSFHDCTFTLHQLVPNKRHDLLKSNWHVFVESFYGTHTGSGSTASTTGYKIGLPDMRIGSHDFMTTGEHETQADDTVAIVTDDREGAVSNGFKYTRVIGEHDIGRSIDLNQLFSGKIRVTMRSADNGPLTDLDDFVWVLRLLFVQKS
eukprot:SAG25_NODE_1752_length_2396_cov_1.905964_3_plen_193_part_00